MRSSTFICVLTVALLVCTARGPPARAQIPSIDVPCLQVPVTLDGAITGPEWSDAAALSTYFHFYNFSADPVEYVGNQSVTLYVKHDSTQLWIGILMEDAIENLTTWPTYPTGMPSALGDGLWIFYDVNGDGWTGAGDDEKGIVHPSFTYDGALIPSFPGYDEDTDLGGTKDIAGASGWAAGWLTYEVVHPLNAGDAAGNDPALAPGDHLAVSFVVMDPEFGNVNQVYAWTSLYDLVIAPCPVGGVITATGFELLTPLLGLGAAVSLAVAALKKRRP